MKPLIVLLCTLATGLWIVDRLQESQQRGLQAVASEEPAASEGTAENPRARIEHDWLRLHDPATGQIPPGIGRRELQFAQRMTRFANQGTLTSADDWIARGPSNVGGRTKALAIDITNEHHILAGSTSSGVFKSTDGGGSWVKTTAPNQIHSLTAIVQNTNPGREHIWYYGTGDRSPSGIVNSAIGQLGTNSFYRGDGIFKSTDGGDTWTQLASTVSGSPDETNTFDFIWGLATFGDDGVLAATPTGVYRSTDGGASWSPSLNFGDNEEYPSTEIAIASDGSVYATIGGAGPDNGVYGSANNGASWDKISPANWPDATTRTVIAPAPSNENVVYFFTEVTDLQQQLRKYEVGVGWTDLTGGLPFNAQIATFGGILMILGVKPDDQNTIFLGAIDLFRSTDGGQSFEVISGTGGNFHVDQTSIAFFPSDPSRMIIGNDGGLYRADDNVAPAVNQSLDWESLNNGYLTSQFYTVAVDHGTPGNETLIGGTQDNGVMYTSASDPTAPWQILFGGDGAFVAIADGEEYIYHANAATFKLFRNAAPFGVAQRTEITPAGVPLGLWLTIFQLDPHDQRVMYLPSQQTLWRNSDLTGIPHRDGGGTTDVNWDSYANVTGHYIHALGMSEAEPRRLYYSAADVSAEADEKIFYLENPHQGQPVPVDVTSEDFPFYPYVPFITRIAVDPRDSQKVIIVFASYGVLSLYATEDGGQNWTPVSGNLEENPDGTGSGPSVRWVSILYVQDQPIYLAATSVGLFSTGELDGMNTVWRPEAPTTIGNVVIDMLDVRQSDGFVAVATHGNGVYSTYITQVPTNSEVGGEIPGGFQLSPAFPNPFAGSTTLTYRLPVPGTISAEVFDIRGRRVASLADGPRTAGAHSVSWNSGDASPGTYFIRVRFENLVKVEKVVLAGR